MKKPTPLLFVTLLLLSVIQYAGAGYDPTIGRWLSRDPLKNAEMKQGPNLYLYARNSPIAYKDPLGLQAVFMCTNGDRKVAKTPQELIQIAQSLSPGSLKSLLFQGHGSNTQQNLTPLDNTSLGGLKLSGGNVNVVDDSENILADLGDLLADKFAPWEYGEQPSIIRLQGCSTASSNSNLTRSVSLEVPSVLVLGSVGPSLGLPGLGGGFPIASQGEGIYHGGNNYNP